MTICDEASLAEMIRELSWHYSYCRGLSSWHNRKRVKSFTRDTEACEPLVSSMIGHVTARSSTI